MTDQWGRPQLQDWMGMTQALNSIQQTNRQNDESKTLSGQGHGDLCEDFLRLAIKKQPKEARVVLSRIRTRILY